MTQGKRLLDPHYEDGHDRHGGRTAEVATGSIGRSPASRSNRARLLPSHRLAALKYREWVPTAGFVALAAPGNGTSCRKGSIQP